MTPFGLDNILLGLFPKNPRILRQQAWYLPPFSSLLAFGAANTGVVANMNGFLTLLVGYYFRLPTQLDTPSAPKRSQIFSSALDDTT